MLPAYVAHVFHALLHIVVRDGRAVSHAGVEFVEQLAIPRHVLGKQ